MEVDTERRFASLKRRLDALHFTEPLTIECMPLVEHILNELIRTTDGFRHLKQSHEQLQKKAAAFTDIQHPESDRLEDVYRTPSKAADGLIQILQRDVTRLEEELRTVKTQSLEGDQSFKLMEQKRIIDTLQSEVGWLKSRRYAPQGTGELRDSTLERLTSENQRLTRENALHQGQVDKLTMDIRLQQDSERALQSQLFSLKQDVDGRTLRRAVLPEDPYSLMSKLSAMDSQKRINENEISNLRFELERMTRLKSATEGQAQFLKSEMIRLKTELETEMNVRVQLSTMKETAQREADLLRQETGGLKSQIDQQRQELLDSDRKTQDLNLQLSSYSDRIRVLEQDYQTLTETHTLTLAQVSHLEQQNSSLSREFRDLKSVENRFGETQRENQQLQSFLSSKDMLVLQTKEEMTRIEEALVRKEQDLNETKANLDVLQRQNLTSEQEKELYEQRSLAFAKKIAALEGEVKTGENRVFQMQQENAVLEEKIGKQYRRIDQLERDVEKSDLDVKHYRSLCLQLTDSEKDARSKLRSTETRLLDISAQSQDEKSQLSQTQSVLQRQQRLYEEAQDQVYKLTEQIQELEAVISDLETARDDLTARLEQTQDLRRQAESAEKRLETDLKTTRDVLNLREKELAQTQETVQRQSHENLYLQKLTEEQTERSQQLTDALHTKEQECVSILERLALLQRQVDDLKSSKSAETAVLEKSISRLQEELYRIGQERDRLKQAYDEAERGDRVSQQLLRTAEKEKEGLFLTYKKSQEENDRLGQSIGVSRAEYQDLYSKLQGYENRFREQEELITRYRAQIKDLETDLQTLKRRLQSSEEKQSLRRSGSSKDFASAGLLADLELERKRTARLEQLLDEQKKVNSELQTDMGKMTDSKMTLKPDNPQSELRNRVDEQRDEILSLEMEVMRLRDELGKSKHLHFKSESKVRDLERKMSGFQTRPELGEMLEP